MQTDYRTIQSNNFIVVGNFNFPNIDSVILSTKSLNGAEFVRSVQNSFLKQYVDNPTRGYLTLYWETSLAR